MQLQAFFSSSGFPGLISISSLPSEARLKFLMLFPRAPPISGSFPAPNTTRTITRTIISSGIPNPNIHTSIHNCYVKLANNTLQQEKIKLTSHDISISTCYKLNMESFRIISDFTPRGDQPRAIDELTEGIVRGDQHQVLLGVTGSGKTFTMANVIERCGRPALVLAPNKTLAAQLYGEFKELFPENAVEYFVSYYDYYQPEAYVPSSDTYIEKDSLINEAIDRMRHSATHALLSRRDVIIVASVSCIYGIGDPDFYRNMVITLEVGQEVKRDAVLRRLIDLQYERNDVDFHRGTFRVRGDVVEIFQAYEEETAVRIEWWGDEIESISEVDP